MSIRSKNKISVSFSMSSMTDIVFLLLIFFIVISTLISPYGLKVLLPNSSAKTTGKKNVTVTITADSQYYVNGELISQEYIEQKLLDELYGIAQPGIVLKADKTVPLEYAVVVMDIANRNKFEMVLATQP